MPKLPPKKNPVSPSISEHALPRDLRHFTAWHYFLARAMEKTKTKGLDVLSFVKLGSLPIEADVILLLLDEKADTQLFAKYFGFLMPALRRCVTIEYKSPDDRLTLSDLDTVRAYAMLAKRKFEIKHDHEVAVAMLYSHTDADFFADCAHNGYVFTELEPGVRQCRQHAMGFYAVDLVAFGERHPEHPINLLSSRRRSYRPSGQDGGLGPFSVLYEELFLKELKKMGQLHAPGSQELLDDAQRTKDLILAQCSFEDLLRRIPAEERLRGIAPEERLRGIAPEERLRGIPTSEILRRIHAEDLVRDLPPAELARLRELLLNKENR
jgi:hypothetical protein